MHTQSSKIFRVNIFSVHMKYLVPYLFIFRFFKEIPNEMQLLPTNQILLCLVSSFSKFTQRRGKVIQLFVSSYSDAKLWVRSNLIIVLGLRLMQFSVACNRIIIHFPYSIIQHVLWRRLLATEQHKVHVPLGGSATTMGLVEVINQQFS